MDGTGRGPVPSRTLFKFESQSRPVPLILGNFGPCYGHSASLKKTTVRDP